MSPETARVEADGITIDDNAVNDVMSWLQAASSPYFVCKIETDSGSAITDDCRDPSVLCHRMIQRFLNNA